MKVFIIGIAGNVGTRLGRLLIARGDTVGGLYRRPEQGERLRTIGLDATHADLVAMTASKLADIMRGADVAVFTAGAAGEGGKSMTTAIDGEGLTKSIAAAREAGVRRLILVSAFPEAGRGQNMPEGFEHYIAVKKRADMELSESDLDWVILRPARLTDDPGTEMVRLGAALVHTVVTRDDVAATLVELVHAPTIRRRIFELTEGATPVAEAVANACPVG